MKRYLLAGFFLFMILCTAISRVYDSVTVPKVITATAKRKTVETYIEGTGTVKVKEKEFCHIEPGLMIRQVMVIPGSQVKEGDILFWYDSESVLERKEELEKELEQIDLNIEKEQISQENYDGLTQTETALWELGLAQRELEEGQAEFQEIAADHAEELRRLEEKYERELNLAEEELWHQQEKDWETASEQLDTVRNSREAALKEQEWKIEDLEEQLNGLSEEDKEGRGQLEKQLRRARKDLSDMKDSWEDQIRSARSQLDFLEYQEDRIRLGQTSVQEARRESYEEAVKQENERMKAAEKELEALNKAVEKVRWQAEGARKQDAAQESAREQQVRISRLTIRELELNRKEKEKELGTITELDESGGAVRTSLPGVVADMELIEGKETTGGELLSLTAGNTQFEGRFIKEDQELSIGDMIEIAVPGTQKIQEAKIARMNLLGETEGIFQADLESSQWLLGTVTSYSCSRQSDVFDKVIPLEGLRKDMKGYYCLVARPVSTILGEEFRAERVEVQVLYQGNQEAAVEGSIFDSDRVIVGENKGIWEGARVRPVSEF